MNEQEHKSKAADIAASKESVVASEEAALEEEKRSFEHEHRTQRTRLGWLGYVFGEGNEKAGNVAGIIAMVCLIALIARFVADAFGFDRGVADDERLNNLVYVLTLCLGYLFGRK